MQHSSHYTAFPLVCTSYTIILPTTENHGTVLHLGQAAWYRTWFMIPTAGFAGILEILGWSGRLWSSQNVHLNTPFMIQFVAPTALRNSYSTSFKFRITGCIIGPTPLLAADFVIFGIIIQRLGEGYSRMAAKWCTYSTSPTSTSSLTIAHRYGSLLFMCTHSCSTHWFSRYLRSVLSGCDIPCRASYWWRYSLSSLKQPRHRRRSQGMPNLMSQLILLTFDCREAISCLEALFSSCVHVLCLSVHIMLTEDLVEQW